MADLVPGEMPKPQDQVPAGETPKDAEEEPFDKARAMETIRKQREEMKDLKAKAKRLTELETAEADRKTAEMTAEQKANEKAEKAVREKNDAIAKANDRIITAELRAQAAALGFTDLDYAVFKVRPKVTLTEDGNVEGAEEALKELAKTSSALIKKGQAPLSPGNPGAPGSGETLAQQRARIYGDGAGIFDRATSDALGGGVFMNNDPNKQP